jgi:uncharacterized protein YcaQ
MAYTVPKDIARKIVLENQLLRGKKIPKGKKGVLRIFEHLGYVQIDTINVIERSHHIVLKTRCPDYKKNFLHILQSKDRDIFEYWAHAASYIPMRDYRFYLSEIERHRDPQKDARLSKWIAENKGLMKKVLNRIKKSGPLSTSDFKDFKSTKRGKWWGWTPVKMALEVLFWQGYLMITERRNFQRYYDLTERVLPVSVDKEKPTLDEEKRFFVRRALQAMGIASTQEINRYIGISGKLNPWIKKMEREKEIEHIEIEGLKREYYCFPRTISDFKKLKQDREKKVLLLSPFDNSIIIRERVRDLFDFEYALECYVPKKKRKFGYFSLPILWDDRLVGMIDPKANRDTNTFIINNIKFIDEKILKEGFLRKFADSLTDLAHFNGCDNVEMSDKVDADIGKKVSKYL